MMPVFGTVFLRCPECDNLTFDPRINECTFICAICDEVTSGDCNTNVCEKPSCVSEGRAFDMGDAAYEAWSDR